MRSAVTSSCRFMSVLHPFPIAGKKLESRDLYRDGVGAGNVMHRQERARSLGIPQRPVSGLLEARRRRENVVEKVQVVRCGSIEHELDGIGLVIVVVAVAARPARHEIMRPSATRFDNGTESAIENHVVDTGNGVADAWYFPERVQNS